MTDTRQRLELPSGASAIYHSLPSLEKKVSTRLSRLSVSLRILLESVLRHLDGRRVRDENVEALASREPKAPRTTEVLFVVGRVLLQDSSRSRTTQPAKSCRPCSNSCLLSPLKVTLNRSEP